MPKRDALGYVRAARPLPKPEKTIADALLALELCRAAIAADEAAMRHAADRMAENARSLDRIRAQVIEDLARAGKL